MATLGHDVVGCDSDEERILSLQAGRCPFFEPGLEDLLTRTMAEGNLSFTPSIEEALCAVEIVFICVGTPPRASGEANLRAVEEVARAVARHAPSNITVVEKSTVPAGTAQRIKHTLELERQDRAAEMDVVSNPEFLREGSAIQDSLQPDRILVGAGSERARSRMRELYAPLVDRGHLLIETDIATAELSKHACNAFLAVKVSYANALARICEKAGADVVAVADVMGSDARIGRAFLNAGLGYGGYCFPKDLDAFQRLAEQAGAPFPLLREVARINSAAIDATLNKIKEALWNLEAKRVGLLGLSFKPDTDDVRFSPALELARQLLRDDAVVVGYDPEAAAAAKAELPELELAPDPYAVAAGAHCIVLCTEWSEFRELDLTRLAESMTYPILVDAPNLFAPEDARTAGFTYYPTGRPMVRA
jgi:UDPglucose 6-dehydrogenase